ncbi:MAG: hypothetical protein AAGF87_07180 [Bacteroidota bacterium]
MPKLVLVPVDEVKNIFTKEYYIPLAIVGGGYYVIINDRNIVETVEYYLFTPIESEKGLEMESEKSTHHQNSTAVFYPEIFSSANRILEPGKYWNVGMDSLHERINTAKGIRKLGIELSQEDKLLLDSKTYRMALFEAAIVQVNMLLSTISDGYNFSSVNCIMREGVKPENLNDVVNYLFYDHGLINGIKLEPKPEEDPKNVKVKTRAYLDLCFGHAATCSKCDQLRFDSIKDRILYDFLTVINDWEYKAYFLHYDTGGGDNLRVIILDEQQHLFIFCLDNWFH